MRISLFILVLVNCVFADNNDISILLETGKNQYAKFEPIYFSVRYHGLSENELVNFKEFRIGMGDLKFCNRYDVCIGDGQSIGIITRKIAPDDNNFGFYQGIILRSIGNIGNSKILYLLGSKPGNHSIYVTKRIGGIIYKSNPVQITIRDNTPQERVFLNSLGRFSSFELLDNSAGRDIFDIFGEKTRPTLEEMINLIESSKETIFYPYFKLLLVGQMTNVPPKNKEHLIQWKKWNSYMIPILNNYESDLGSSDPYLLINTYKDVSRYIDLIFPPYDFASKVKGARRQFFAKTIKSNQDLEIFDTDSFETIFLGYANSKYLKKNNISKKDVIKIIKREKNDE